MFAPISIEDFAESTMKNNKGYNRKELVRTLRETLQAKKNGAKCMICGAPIWAAGSAITGTYMCFTCTTGEADDSEDYEIEYHKNIAGDAAFAVLGVVFLLAYFATAPFKSFFLSSSKYSMSIAAASARVVWPRERRVWYRERAII